MSELTLLVLQLGFLALLWIFVFIIIYALRSDLFGKKVRKPQPAAEAPAPAPTPAPTMASTGTGMATTSVARRLVITSGTKSGTEFPLGTDEITIGRSSDSTIVIRDDYTSTHHARLMLWNNQWMVQDLDSTNGTYLDGERVNLPTAIPLDTKVKIGATTFELRR